MKEGLDGRLRELLKVREFLTEEEERASVRRFLDELSKKERDIYFRRWSKIDKFDYLTFLGFLKDEAQDMKDEEMVSLLNKNIHQILQGEREVMKLKDHIKTAEKIRSENEARGIKDELNPVDKILDRIEENTK